MKVLVTGAHGQLGTELRRCFETGRAEIGPVPEAYRGAEVDYIDYDDLDISDTQAVSDWFAQHGPYNLVVNCAAITDVDGCELDETRAWQVNAFGAQNLSQASTACGAKFVHVSTDYVFSGTDPEPRVEDDPAEPTSAYGRTKLTGEKLALAAGVRVFVVRTAWLYGYVGHNFAKTMMRLARKNGSISVVGDQYGNPTSANDVAYEILRIAQTRDFGIYHCTNEGTCSWFDFACAVVDGAGIDCAKESLTSAEYKERFPKSADRPAYSSLRNKRLEETIGNEMRPWQEALATYLANFEELAD